MQKFNLETAIDNPGRVVFRDRGGLVEVNEFIYLSGVNDEEQPIIIIDTDGAVTRHNVDGSYHLTDQEARLDLMLDTEITTRWANVYTDKYSQHKIGGLYATRHEAKGIAYDNPEYITTIKIEWEV